MVDFEVQHPVAFLVTEAMKIGVILLAAHLLAMTVAYFLPDTGMYGPFIQSFLPVTIRQMGLVTGMLYAFARVMQA